MMHEEEQPDQSVKVSIPINADEDGFTGRECPSADCEGYFKIQSGTGLKGEGLPCHCPYCGHTALQDQFSTKEQRAYALSAALRGVADALYAHVKTHEFDHRPRGAFGIGGSLKVTPGEPVPIHHYREKKLETEVVCSNCTLRYAVYGVFAFCADCGQRNSLQILEKNLDLVSRMLDLEPSTDTEMASRLIDNSLEDCVSAFDGFGRELCQLHAKKSSNPTRAENVSFQNLDGARKNVNDLFGLDFSSGIATTDWNAAIIGFQKRHLLSHTMGVVDENYILKSGDTKAVLGRKLSIEPAEVRDLVTILRKLGQHLSAILK